MKNDYTIYLDDNTYQECVNIAKERHEQKKKFKSCKPFSDNYELVGVIGEMIFHKLSGLDMDKRLLINGDDGTDFKFNIQIKTSEEHKAKHLIEFTDKIFNGFYIFVIVNLKEKYGYVKGIITSDDFKKNAKIMNFGYGDRYALSLEYIPKKYR